MTGRLTSGIAISHGVSLQHGCRADRTQKVPVGRTPMHGIDRQL